MVYLPHQRRSLTIRNRPECYEQIRLAYGIIYKWVDVVLVAMREVLDVANAKTVADAVGYLCVLYANGSLGKPVLSRLAVVVRQLLNTLDDGDRCRINIFTVPFRDEAPGAYDGSRSHGKVLPREMGSGLRGHGPARRIVR